MIGLRDVGLVLCCRSMQFDDCDEARQHLKADCALGYQVIEENEALFKKLIIGEGELLNQ